MSTAASKFNSYLAALTNVAVLIGLVFLIVELRQNNAGLATSNAWSMAQSGIDVWTPLVESQGLAAIEAKVRTHQPLNEIEAIRYEAYVWMRLESVWSMYDLYRAGVLSEAEWNSSLLPTQDRAAEYPIVAEVIRQGPMPDPLKELLLAHAIDDT